MAVVTRLDKEPGHQQQWCWPSLYRIIWTPHINKMMVKFKYALHKHQYRMKEFILNNILKQKTLQQWIRLIFQIWYLDIVRNIVVKSCTHHHDHVVKYTNLGSSSRTGNSIWQKIISMIIEFCFEILPQKWVPGSEVSGDKNCKAVFSKSLSTCYDTCLVCIGLCYKIFNITKKIDMQ